MLSFESLRIQNFQSFTGEHHLSLSGKGLCYVIGVNHSSPDLSSNGSGKTSTFNALLWCLYGKSLRSARPGASIEPWNKAVPTQVEVSFHHDDMLYLVRRTRHPNLLLLNGETVDQETLDKAIGLSFEAATNTFIIGQFNEMFLSLKPERQAALFSELLNLDQWLAAADKAAKKVRELERLITDNKLVLSRYEGQLAELAETIKRTQEQRDGFEARRTVEQERLARDLARALAALPGRYTRETARALVGESKTALASLAAQQRALAQTTISAERESAVLEAQLDKIKREILSYDVDNAICPACGQEISIDHIEIKITQLTKHAADLTKQYNATIDDLESYDDDKRDLDKEIKKINDEMDALNSVLINIDRLQANLNQCVDGANPFNASLEHAHNRYQNIKKQHTLLEKNNAALEIESGNYRIWIDGYKQIRLNLIDETLLDLELAVNSNAELLGLHGWSITFNTERETRNGELRNKFNVSVYPPGQMEPIAWECFSGGESQRWNLACLFGLSETVLDRAGLSTNLLILDEPTSHLSASGVDFLLSYLSERAQELNQTIYFVDHHSLDRGYFNSILQVEKHDEGSSFSWL